MQYGTYKILTPEKAKQIREILETQDWEQGKARTAELTGSIKRNLELKPGHGPELALVTEMSRQCTSAIATNMEVQLDTLLRQMMSCKFNKFEPNDATPDGGSYERHTDAPWMGPVRTDFTAVLALTPKDDYEGGDHHVVHPHMGEMVFRPDAGELMIYETGYAHWVDPVTKGARISGLTWIESTVPDARQRALLKVCRGVSADMEQKIDYTDDDCQFRKWFVDVGVLHSGLQRMWANR